MEKKREVEVEQFWRDKEQELGEPILLKSISHTFQSGSPDTFGILFASPSFLVFEHSKGARRSILEVLFSRREDKLSEQLKIPRGSIRLAALASSYAARRWVARSLDPAEVLSRLAGRRPSLLLNLLSGTSLCVCTDSQYIVLDTPTNRQWLALLRT